MNTDTARGLVAQQIKTDNPTWVVKDYAATAPDTLGRAGVFCSVGRTSLVPYADNPSVLIHNLAIEVMVASTSTKAEDECDAALDRVLLSLERINGARWSTATRATFDGKYFGYQVEAQVDSKNVYRQLVIEENQE